MKDILDWLHDNGLMSLISAGVGGVIAVLLGALRRSIQTVSYSVVNNQVGISANDRIHGEVRVTYRGNPLRNLHMSIITVTNTTARDLDEFTFTVCAGQDTLLMTEETAIDGQPYAIAYSDDYRNSLALSSGQEPTDAQGRIYTARREYTVKGFNRKQSAIVRILCHVPNFDHPPRVWVATRQTGLKVTPLPTGPHFMGVPVKLSATVGLAVSVLTLAVVIWLAKSPWVAAAICMIVGLFAQVIAAGIIKTVRAIRNLLAG